MFRVMFAAAVATTLSVMSAQAANVPGTTYETIDVGGVERTFIVHVGTNVPAEGPVPVVFMFHGTSGDGQRFYDISGWRELADAEGFIAVFPDALRHCFFEDENGDGDFADAGELKLTTKWSAGQFDEATMPLCAGDVIARLPARAQATVDHPVADDLGFVDGMIAFLEAEFVVDTQRIFGSGFSNGAQFTSRLAAERSDVFAALASHAGVLSVPIVAARSVPFVASIGTMDDRFTSRLAVAELPIDEPGILAVAGGYIGLYLQLLGLTETHVFEERRAGAKRLAVFTYTEGVAGTAGPFVFMIVEDNFHAYPNGRNHPLPMAPALWEFFQDHPLP